VAAALGGAITAAVVLAGPAGQSAPTGGPAGVGPTPTDTSTPEPTATPTNTPLPPPYAAYSDFEAMTLVELETLQVKLTHVGQQDRIIGTIALTSPANALDLSSFVPFRRPGYHYGNDEVPEVLLTFTASSAELAAMISALGALPSVTGGAAAPDGVLSLMLFNSTSSGDKGFEAITNLADSEAVLQAMGASLAAGNTPGLQSLRALWTSLGFGVPGF